MANRIVADVAAECWRPVPGFPDYEASSLGRIRIVERERLALGRWNKMVARRLNGHLVAPQKHPVTGYLLVAMVDDSGKRRHLGVHAVIARAFHGLSPSADHQAAHWDGDKENNRSSNVRWATRSENAVDKMRHHGRNGGCLPCEAHHAAKLTNEQAAQIIRRVAAGEVRNRLAREFGVHRSTVYDLVSGRRWRKLPVRTDGEQSKAQA